ncbi:MAG: CopG family transcriptional regulator [Actinomycetota bacterium]
MTERNDRGHTTSGAPITDELIEELADEAERGFDVDHLLGRRGKRGRPPLGAAAATVESVRLDPDLRERLAQRAQEERVSVSEVIREALRQHLERLAE